VVINGRLRLGGVIGNAVRNAKSKLPRQTRWEYTSEILLRTMIIIKRKNI